jgi:hypothetical protein
VIWDFFSFEISQIWVTFLIWKIPLYICWNDNFQVKIWRNFYTNERKVALRLRALPYTKNIVLTLFILISWWILQMLKCRVKPKGPGGIPEIEFPYSFPHVSFWYPVAIWEVPTGYHWGKKHKMTQGISKKKKKKLPISLFMGIFFAFQNGLWIFFYTL